MQNIKSEKGNITIHTKDENIYLYNTQLTIHRIITSQDFKTQKGTIIILFYE